jgi:hypothetical protein
MPYLAARVAIEILRPIHTQMDRQLRSLLVASDAASRAWMDVHQAMTRLEGALREAEDAERQASK